MTVCFVAQFGPICVAAADTRISGALDDSLPSYIWDAADMPITTPTGEYCLVPIRFRKIRQIGRGWAVSAGSHTKGKRALDMLCSEAAFGVDQVTDVLNHMSGDIKTEPGSPRSVEEDLSFILGVSVEASGRGVWCASNNDPASYAVSDSMQFAINWPTSIAPELGANATDVFKKSLDPFRGVASIVRSAARLIGAAQSAPDCSPVAQIGVTWMVSDAEYQTRYIAGNVDELSHATNDQIQELWEVLPTLLPS
ncbi:MULTISPECIES: hypothetical protein [unclassified Massilia]|uniref:hypothetical protein n=1 Tax=unclassified Massilia TaxID=2609279 RepID=UPI0012E35C12|nr:MULTISPECIES: hypothetical protein [unclassified Massilia]